jgi:hypothetical protein
MLFLTAADLIYEAQRLNFASLETQIDGLRAVAVVQIIESILSQLTAFFKLLGKCSDGAENAATNTECALVAFKSSRDAVGVAHDFWYLHECGKNGSHMDYITSQKCNIAIGEDTAGAIASARLVLFPNKWKETVEKHKGDRCKKWTIVLNLVYTLFKETSTILKTLVRCKAAVDSKAQFCISKIMEVIGFLTSASESAPSFWKDCVQKDLQRVCVARQRRNAVYGKDAAGLTGKVPTGKSDEEGDGDAAAEE